MPFAVELGREEAYTRDVATGPSEGSHKTVQDHVLGHLEQRYCLSRLLKRSQRQLRTGDDHIRRRRDKGGCDARDLVVRYAEAAWDKEQILPFNEAVEAQFVKEINNGRRLTRRRKKETNTINAARLLRPRGDRPRGSHAAHNSDELPSMHMIFPSVRGILPDRTETSEVGLEKDLVRRPTSASSHLLLRR